MLKDDTALEEYRKTHQGKKYQVSRFKGLGELSVDETEDTLINPENRIIKQITIEDIEATNKLFSDLMGSAILPRKQFIKNYSKEATYAI